MPQKKTTSKPVTVQVKEKPEKNLESADHVQSNPNAEPVTDPGTPTEPTPEMPERVLHRQAGVSVGAFDPETEDPAEMLARHEQTLARHEEMLRKMGQVPGKASAVRRGAQTPNSRITE